MSPSCRHHTSVVSKRVRVHTHTRAEGLSSSAGLAARQRLNTWKGEVEDELERRLKERCDSDGGSRCSAIVVTVTRVSRVSSRRSLLEATVDVESRASGSTVANSEAVTNEIRSSGSFSAGGRDYSASNARTSEVQVQVGGHQEKAKCANRHWKGARWLAWAWAEQYGLGSLDLREYLHGLRGGERRLL